MMTKSFVNYDEAFRQAGWPPVQGHLPHRTLPLPHAQRPTPYAQHPFRTQP
jgi:hypothetical protein